MERTYNNQFTAPSIRFCEICGVSNKEKNVYWSGKTQKYLCDKHRQQLEKHGKAYKTHRDKNEIIEHDDYIEIILRDKDFNETGKALIDKEDYKKCSEYVWTLWVGPKNKKGYVTSKEHKTRKRIRLHRFVLGYDGDLEVDHINKNPLDNRKSNLRIVDHDKNSANMPGKGVTISNNKYLARIQRKKRVYRLGYFNTEEEALLVVNKAKQEYDTDPKEFENKYKMKSTYKR